MRARNIPPASEHSFRIQVAAISEQFDNREAIGMFALFRRLAVGGRLLLNVDRQKAQFTQRPFIF